ncbi:MAG: hypothetical protein R3B46_01950 [Phycisphaerales bacterium]
MPWPSWNRWISAHQHQPRVVLVGRLPLLHHHIPIDLVVKFVVS